jgi:outer membrane protein assembly factor BamB
MFPIRQGWTALSLLASLLLVLPGYADPAGTYRGDLGHSGYSSETLTLPVSLLWRHTTEASPLSPVSPVYAEGLIYFSAGDHVYAINAKDGATVWRYPSTDDNPTVFASTPTVDQGAVYVGSDAGDLDKIDAKSGQLIWSKSVGGAVRGAPTVDGNTVYFGSSDYHCYAKDTKTGTTLWSFPTNGLISSAPNVSDRNVYFASGDDSVYCLEKATGKKVWSLAFNTDPTAAPPVYSDDVLYVSVANVVHAINARSGETLWNVAVGSGVTAMPTVGPDFVGVAALDGTYSVFDHHGRLRWRRSLGNPAYAPQFLTDNVILIPGRNGVIFALNADTGKLVWEYADTASVTKKLAPPTNMEIYSAPLVVDHTLYVLSDDGTLSALTPTALATLPPRITAMVPEPGSVVSGSGIAPSATVVDEGAGIDPRSVSLSVDGQAVQGVLYDAYSSQIKKDMPGADAKTLDQLSDGAHEIVVTAKDWHGNVVIHSWGFFVDNAQPAQDNGPMDNGGPMGDNGP